MIRQNYKSSHTGKEIDDAIDDVGKKQNAITERHKLNADLVDDSSSAHKFVTASQKSEWSAKGTYSKPSGGIPPTDLSSDVLASLGKADTALQEETDPTVPAWAKADTKPTYTAFEVGAVPTTRKVNGKALSEDITLTATDVNAIPNTTVIPDEQIQSDWNQTNTSARDYIKNKPVLPDAQIQSDWNETNAGEKDFIKNKPDIYTKADTDILLSSKQDKLISGTNIKTINNQSLLGSGNIVIQGGGGGGGAIDSISVNGTPQPIEDGNVDITVPTKVSDLTNDSGFITTESDPTVPSWAKASSKPSYTASEVGAVPTTRKVNGKALSADITLSASDVNALPSSTVIPDELKDLSDDSTHRLVTDTEKSTWNAKGTYSKPSGGIPATDLASAVQTSLGKADTAIQSVKVNGTALTPDANKAVDVKTNPAVVSHGTSDTTFAVTPNILHIWGTVGSLTLTLATPTDNTIENEYKIQFTSGSTATQFSLPQGVEWGTQDPEQPNPLVVKANAIYQISIINNIGLWTAIANS